MPLTKPAEGEDADYISDKFNKISERITELDGLLNQKAEGWNTARMGKVDLTIPWPH